MKLDFQLDREAAPPKDAATIILIRPSTTANALEVFCVERSKQSKFMGGAIVFPGGKVDASDGDASWAGLVDGAVDRFTIAAERETLEEACILHVTEGVDHDTLIGLRADLAKDPQALRAFLASRNFKLDLKQLHPFARWITPTAESRRFDARFFIAAAPVNQPGAHDSHETMSSFWATPADILKRWEKGEVALAPPTHATLFVLSRFTTVTDAIAFAEQSAGHAPQPICPKLVQQGDTLALALPGDREHDVHESRVSLDGATRYVLRGERWLPENAP
jgi:8-oxo-dGTP pyrophosphatase MutT (NUDIX family)